MYSFDNDKAPVVSLHQPLIIEGRACKRTHFSSKEGGYLAYRISKPDTLLLYCKGGRYGGVRQWRFVLPRCKDVDLYFSCPKELGQL